MRARAILVSFLLSSCALAAQSPPVPSPDSLFGFALGTEGRLAAADDLDKYFRAVEASSNRVKLVDIGTTTDGHHTIAAIVSAPDNIRNLEAIRTANQQLADPRVLSDDDAKRLVASHKAIVAVGASIHASEVGATQTAAQLLYELSSTTNPETLEQLSHLVVIIIPMLNPDGYRMVVDWYNQTKGTSFEGTALPWPDHKYAGHDINRDAFMMNLAESRNLARFFYRDWHPHVFLSMHQMDDGGARFFAPPVADPIDPNVNPIAWREAALLGSAMTLQLERDGHTGVVSSSLFDYFSPGYEDTAPLGHNIVCLLTEAARVKIATAIDEPSPDQDERTPRVSAPHAWSGGRWSLHDIVDYELSAVRGLLRAVDRYRDDVVANFYAMGKRAVDLGTAGSPFAFVIPPTQHDAVAVTKLEQLLLDAGVEIERTSELFAANGVSFPAGTDIIFLAQPFRAYIKTLMERQDYPVAGSNAERPYDVTGWTLPAQMGVDVRVIDHTFEAPVMSHLR
ncbi:MAG TPA: M14 metallopeptidase family protein, partial [Vicinamibacterales bacterium]|nr:M14 metallopeptidase family protein [Vicinamibacterales bacterium]